MIPTYLRCLMGLVLVLALTTSGQAQGGGLRKGVQETVDYLFQRFGRNTFREGAESLARRVEVFASRHGDDFLKAIRRVGPRTIPLVEEAGAHANQAVRMLARYGEHGANWIVGRPKGMQLVLKYGEGAAEALVKHKGIAEPVLEKLGRPAIRALQATNVQSGRRLAMLLESGAMARGGRTGELLEVIAKYGDRGVNWIWANKGALATAAGLAAFLSHPEAFITGAKDMAQIVGENAVKPVLQIPGAVATEVARGTNWTVIFLFLGLAALFLLAVKYLPVGNALREALKPGKRLATASGAKTDTDLKDTPVSSKVSQP